MEGEPGRRGGAAALEPSRGLDGLHRSACGSRGLARLRRGPDAGPEKRPGQHPLNHAQRVRCAATLTAQGGRCGGLVCGAQRPCKGVRQQEGGGKGGAPQRGRGEGSQAAIPSRDRPEAAARRSRDRVRIEGRRPALDRRQVKHAPREGQGNGSHPCPPRVKRDRLWVWAKPTVSATRKASTAYTMPSAFACLPCCIRDKPRALRAPCAVALRVPPPVVRCERSQTSVQSCCIACVRGCVGGGLCGVAAPPVPPVDYLGVKPASASPSRRYSSAVRISSAS